MTPVIYNKNGTHLSVLKRVPLETYFRFVREAGPLILKMSASQNSFRVQSKAE